MWARIATALALTALAGPVLAGTAASAATQQYKLDRAACMRGATNQERATCLKEAGAVLREARRGGMGKSTDSQLANNRIARCDAQPAADREDCLRRMGGEGSTSGSAQQGGIARELTRPVAPKP